MSESLPPFLKPAFLAPKLPDWLTATTKREPNSQLPQGKPDEVQRLLVRQFEMAFPRVLDRMCGGETLTQILADFPVPVDRGAFMRWIKKDAQRFATYKEAKEVRTEIWTGEMIRHAEGTDSLLDLDRAKFLVDTYKFLIRAENKKEYGDTKTVEVNQMISITAALQQAQTRVQQVIDVDMIDDDTDPVLHQIAAAQDEDEYAENE